MNILLIFLWGACLSAMDIPYQQQIQPCNCLYRSNRAMPAAGIDDQCDHLINPIIAHHSAIWMHSLSSIAYTSKGPVLTFDNIAPLKPYLNKNVLSYDEWLTCVADYFYACSQLTFIQVPYYQREELRKQFDQKFKQSDIKINKQLIFPAIQTQESYPRVRCVFEKPISFGQKLMLAFLNYHTNCMQDTQSHRRCTIDYANFKQILARYLIIKKSEFIPCPELNKNSFL